MRRVCVLGAAALAVVASGAGAQSDPQRDPPAAPPVDAATVDRVAVEALRPAPPGQQRARPAGQLEEVIVTAERREASLQDTPISIEAFDAEMLEQRSIKGVQDLSANVPALTIEPFPTHNATLRVFIRGVGINDAQLTQDPAVGVYLDGVYIARSVGLALDIADLERIEVLRGPQGTLYGRNTTGGAINLITKRPSTDAFTFSTQAGGASRSNYLAKASFNIPLGDTLAVGLGLLGSTRNGFVENTGPGGDFGDRSEYAGRFTARWTPADWLRADYSYDYTDMRYHNYMFQSVLLPATNKGQAEVVKPYAISQTVYSDRRLEQLATGMPLEESGTRINGHALTLAVPLDRYELKYIGAWRDLRDEQYADLGGGAGSTTYRLDTHAYDGAAALVANGGPTPLVIPTVTQEQWSHELQLTGTLFGDSLDFVVGAYYFSETGRENRHRLNHNFSSVLPVDGLDELSTSLPDLDPLFDALGIVDFTQIEQLRLVNFADLDWTID
ncbi:MAG: TonB-dependent receptor, partial [Gammaproteobacteria bacterium]